MNHLIFVTTEYSSYNNGIFEEVLKNTIKEKIWKIGLKTGNRYKVKKDDKVVVYLTGENNKKFLLSFLLNSEFKPVIGDIYGYVEIKDMVIFHNPKPIKKIIKKLEFIKFKDKWGIYFQNGIISITKKDYILITNNERI